MPPTPQTMDAPMPSFLNFKDIVVAHHTLMRRFQNRKRYGFGILLQGKSKHRPMFANKRKKPRSIPIGDSGFHVESTLTTKKQEMHLLGLRPYFHISSDDKPESYLTLDIDGHSGVEGADWQLNAAFGCDAIRTLFPNVEPFVEMGRSAPGKPSAYASFRAIWTGETGPE